MCKQALCPTDLVQRLQIAVGTESHLQLPQGFAQGACQTLLRANTVGAEAETLLFLLPSSSLR